jgi:hypothetical protein
MVGPRQIQKGQNMNRIYQGKVIPVEIRDGKDEDGQPKWKPLDNWPAALWHHHQLFQDAVNYYALALAAMASEVAGDSAEASDRGREASGTDDESDPLPGLISRSRRNSGGREAAF